MRALLLSLLVLLAQAGPAAATDRMVSSEVLRLTDLIAYRLELMPSVAAWKWRNDRPIEDLAREAIVLDAASARAGELGLDSNSAKAFLAAQIEASKAVQQISFDRWQREGFPPDLPDQDLKRLLRPAISAAGDAILEQLVLARPLLDDPWHLQAFTEILAARAKAMGLQPETAQEIVSAAANLSFAPVPATLLDRILQQGTLRVGTTGDYAPFSSGGNGDLKGIDIDLAQNLANSLGVEIEWVETSWPSLMDDFRAGAFDIGMSGISRTLERQRDGYFSQPYHTGGKTPIVRCGEEAQFDTLDEIDRPDVRVIVNPGGTNQRFVDANLEDADVRVFPDNRTVFAEIAENRADVMITDQIEVRLQSSLMPTLCPALEGTFTHSEKAFLLPRDQTWLNYVNAWLDQAKGMGQVQEAFIRHLAQ